MSWRVASSLIKFVAQVDQLAPKRKKASDGTIGDASHASKASDHNPWVKDGKKGVVTAADVTHDPAGGCDCAALAASLVASRDSRIKYIIYNKQMWRSYDKSTGHGTLKAWSPGPYSGINNHSKHLHLSVQPQKSLYDDVSPWAISLTGEMAGVMTIAGHAVRQGGEALAWGASVTPEFRQRVREISAMLQVEPSNLMAVMAFETGRTFSASIRNPITQATGLIQFMPKTAQGLGTTIDELASITPFEQLVFVYRHLKPYAGRMKDIYDLYMAVLWPAAVDKPVAHVLFASPSKAYQANHGLDANSDGAITKAEAADKVVRLLIEGLQKEHVAA